MGLRERALQEWGYLRADVKSLREKLTVQRVSAAATLGGIAAVIYWLAQWETVVAGVVLGLVLIVWGMLFVDVDTVTEGKQRRWKR